MKTENTLDIIQKFFSKASGALNKSQFGEWLVNDQHSNEKREAMKNLWLEVDSEANDETLKDLELLHNRIAHSSHKPRYFLRMMRVAAAIMFFITGSYASYLYISSTRKTEEVKMLQCFVPYGERKSITLPDGSIAWLNAGSLLVYPEKFSGGNRSLYLSGEAEFTVVKNKFSPFIVHTGYIEVEALGTVFSVTSFPSDSTTKAMLEEGSIRVGIGISKIHTIADNRVLKPNELLTYSHNTGKITIENVDAKLNSKWKSGYLIFKTATLSEILKNIERRHNVVIVYDKQKMGAGIYNVKFLPNENVQQNLEVLRKLIPEFNYKIKGNTIQIN